MNLAKHFNGAKIALIVGTPTRELPRHEYLRDRLLEQYPHYQVEIFFLFEAGAVKKIVDFKPSAILIFPLRSKNLCHSIYLIKFMTKCLVVSYAVEGLVIYENKLGLSSGQDTYGSRLVDFEIYWGPKPAKIMGENLVRDKKLSSINRVVIAGNLELERDIYHLPKLRDILDFDMVKIIQQYSKDRILLFTPSFPGARYTRDLLAKAGDIPDHLLESRYLQSEISRQLRALFISSLSECAKVFHDYLFIVKKHPIEENSPYDAFDKIDNIIFIKEQVPVSVLMQYALVQFHNGSTTMTNAYVMDVPSVYLYSKAHVEEHGSLYPYPPCGLESHAICEFNSIKQQIKNIIAGNLTFSHLNKTDQVLHETFNFDSDLPYRPSNVLIKTLLRVSERQNLPITDIHLMRSLAYVVYRKIVVNLARIMGKSLAIIQ